MAGDFKKGRPVGRKAGGYVFHHMRNIAATKHAPVGMEEADATKGTGHTTTHVFRHYDIGPRRGAARTTGPSPRAEADAADDVGYADPG